MENAKNVLIINLETVYNVILVLAGSLIVVIVTLEPTVILVYQDTIEKLQHNVLLVIN